MARPTDGFCEYCSPDGGYCPVCCGDRWHGDDPDDCGGSALGLALWLAAVLVTVVTAAVILVCG